MAHRGWSFLGGVLIVSTVTYLNMSTIQILAKDMQDTLNRESRKLQAARSGSKSASTSTSQPGTKRGSPLEGNVRVRRVEDVVTWSTTGRVADRIKKMWNEDIEKSIRKVQKTDWERMGRGFGEHVKRAKERIVGTFERMGEEGGKKST
jgi:hypothetical protein